MVVLQILLDFLLQTKLKIKNLNKLLLIFIFKYENLTGFESRVT